jgi:hypothetical protein
MPTAREVAKNYFELSNKSNFDSIAKLFTPSTTYSSQNTGIFLGSTDIINMQKAFHDKFTSLHWKVKSVKEVKPGIIMFEYEFKAKKPNGESIESSGLE